MHTKIVAVVAITLMCLFVQLNPCHSRILVNEQGVEELLENNAEPTNIIKTITGEETPVEKTSKYSCFPWIFNPGNYLSLHHLLIIYLLLSTICSVMFIIIIYLHVQDAA